MTLLDLCEPLFQHVCRLNRAGRKDGKMEYSVARAEIKGIFSDMEAKAAGDPRLKLQYKEVEMPLRFFVDSMICESKLSFTAQWTKNRLAYESREMAGDEKFFDLLEEVIRDQSDEASERLAVYYTCIGLGFTGWYADQPEYLRKKLLEISPRIRQFLQSDTTAHVCEEAYENTDRRNLFEPPSKTIGYIAITFVVLFITTFIANYSLFREASNRLTLSLQQLVQQDKSLGQ